VIQFIAYLMTASGCNVVANADVQANLIAQPMTGRDNANEAFKVFRGDAIKIADSAVRHHFVIGWLPQDAFDPIAFTHKI